MHRVLPYFTLALLVAGCRAPGSWPAETTPPAFADQGAFALLASGDTTVVEEFSRTPSVLEGLVRPQVRGAEFGWARYRVEFGPEGQPERAELQLGRVGTSPGSAASELWSVIIQDSALQETRADRPSTRRQVPVGTVPVFAPSMAMNHEVIRQAILRGGRNGSVEVPIYPVANVGGVQTVTVGWPAPDTAVVAFPGEPGARFVVDEHGRVLGGETTALDRAFTTVRLR